MILSIYGIRDQEDQDQQRLVLVVTSDGNLKNYAVVDNTFDEQENITNLHRHFFSFPDWEVKQGDKVILYTKTGSNYSKNQGTHHNHFFYWNLDISVWNNQDTVYLLQMIDSSNKRL